VSGPEAGLPHPLPGAVGLSHLSAYDWEAADGVCGGSPHLHLVCTAWCREAACASPC
jgi:hypothetical protein